MKIPYSGGWRNAYATLAQSIGFEARQAGSRIAIYHKGVCLDTIAITRKLDLETDLPNLLLHHQKKQRVLAEEERIYQEGKGRNVDGLTQEDLISIHRHRRKGIDMRVMATVSAMFGGGF